MRKLKYGVLLSVLVLFIMSCSLFNNLKEKLGNKQEDDKKEETRKEETTKEETTTGTSQSDLEFYNKYIDVLNKISETVEQFHKSYLSEVPDPKTLRKNSMVFAIASGVYESQMESTIKNYNRSLFDNGELSKLKPDNAQMKQEIESSFKEVLTAAEDYQKLSKEVIDYYQNKKYQDDLSPAAGYEEKMKNSYDKYKEAYDKFNSAVKKYKPKRTRRDPDQIHDPDQKSAAVLMNAYENTLDGAEEFYEKFQKLDKDGSTAELSAVVDSFEAKFMDDTKKIQSTGFTDRTKFMKYNFEDYFTKTVNDFISETRKFFDSVNKKKLNAKGFNDGYDKVIQYYNYMINAYNSSIGTINTISNINY